jgi:AmmeMemoRadiSam system protein B
MYSGAVAATGMACLGLARGAIRRVVLLGTGHYPGLAGIVSTTAAAFRTPLGDVPVDRDAVLTHLSQQVVVDDLPHEDDHALEVQLPFLQVVLGDFVLVPYLVGACAPDAVVALLNSLWGGAETVIVVSSDLSHYHDYETGRRIDLSTAQAIEGLRPEAIERNQACGHVAIRGLLEVAREHHLSASTVALRSSGDTGGPRERVVGYGAFEFHETSQN